VFKELEKGTGLLGWMECKVVKTVNLWEIEGKRQSDDAGKSMRSQLFIAEVDSVKIGESGKDKGSLVWIEQNYRAIVP